MDFDRFVDLALYHPLYGYYNQAAPRRGKAGDYFTSLQVGDLFPRIFAEAIIQLKETLGTEHFSLIEVGSGGGEFLEKVLTVLEEKARTEKKSIWGVRTYAVERSRTARDLLHKRLSRFSRCEVVASVNDIEWNGTLEGCIFSNEFFDALPFHRLRWRGKSWNEVVVSLKNGEIVEEEIPHPVAFGDRPLPEGRGKNGNSLSLQGEGWGEGIGEGHEITWRPGISQIYEEWSARLARGYVLTVDYGHPREAFFSPTRANGSWLCYHQHQANKNPFENIGEQDITAHVDFTQLVEAGKAQSFDPALFCSQGIFLSHVGQKQLEQWLATAPDAEKRHRTGAVQQLIHPDAMGEAFWVLLQNKGVEMPPAFAALPNRLRRLI